MRRPMLMLLAGAAACLMTGVLLAQPGSLTVPPDRALFIIKVPADATLTIGDQPTKQTGPERVFTTQSLTAGATYAYDIVATWKEKGEAKTVKRTVKFQVGQVKTIDLTGQPKKDTDKKPTDKKPTDENKDKKPDGDKKIDAKDKDKKPDGDKKIETKDKDKKIETKDKDKKIETKDKDKKIDTKDKDKKPDADKKIDAKEKDTKDTVKKDSPKNVDKKDGDKKDSDKKDDKDKKIDKKDDKDKKVDSDKDKKAAVAAPSLTGAVQSVDTQKGSFTIANSEGKSGTFQVNESTKFIGSAGGSRGMGKAGLQDQGMTKGSTVRVVIYPDDTAAEVYLPARKKEKKDL